MTINLSIYANAKFPEGNYCEYFKVVDPFKFATEQMGREYLKRPSFFFHHANHGFAVCPKKTAHVYWLYLPFTFNVLLVLNTKIIVME